MSLVWIVSTAAAVCAWIETWRRASHRPVAVALSIGLAANVGRLVLMAWVLPPANFARDAPPISGPLVLAIYVDRALYLAWPAAVAALAVRVFTARRTWPVWLTWAAVCACLALSYPASRFDTLRRVYLAADLGAAVVSCGLLVPWWRGETPADLSTVSTAVLSAALLVWVLTGPHRYGLFAEAWNLSPYAYVLAMGSIVLLHATAWIQRSRQ
jgi:hypothetical protein